MFKKNFSLIVLIVTLFSFNCSLKAMEDPQRNKQSDKEASGSTEISYSVSERIVSPYIWLSNESFVMIENHCAYLEQFKEHAFLEITEENLKKYKELLCLLFKQGININLVFSAISDYFQKVTTNSIIYEKFCDSEGFHGETLSNINWLLQILWGRRINGIAKDNLLYGLLGDTITCIFKANLVDLYLLLAEENLWPSLDTILTKNNHNLFMQLVRFCNDGELFKLIISREKARAYDWNSLFSMHSNIGHQIGLTVLHYAAIGACKDILEILLKLMEEKDLDLEHFMYIKDNDDFREPMRIVVEDKERAQFELIVNYTTGIRKIVNKAPVYSLKFLTASRYLKALKNGELDLSASTELPKELQFYYASLDTISKHCDLVETCKEPRIGVTPEALNNYRNLLYIIFDKENIDVNLILRSFDRYFKIIIENPEQFVQAHTIDGHNNVLTLTNINTFLAMFIRRMVVKQDNAQDGFVWSRLETATLFSITTYILQYNLDDLLLFLARENLLLPLNYTIENNTFGSFFARLVIGCKNIDIFNGIINKEKDKEYNWKELFDIGNQFATVLHYAILSGSKEKVEAILNLIREKDLDLANFINIQSRDGKTPLVLANEEGYSEIAELLISNGAQ